MKQFAARYGDYLLFIVLFIIKLTLFSLATQTHFDVGLFIISLGSLFLLSWWILLVPQRIRRWLLLGFSVLLTFLLASNIWYYRYFTDFLSVSLLIQAPQMGDVGGGMQDLIYISDFLFFIDVVIILGFLIWDRKRSFTEYRTKSRFKAAGVAAVTGIVLFTTPLLINTTDRDEWLVEDSLSNMRNYFKVGMIGHHALDLAKEINEQWIEEPTLSDSEREEVVQFFDLQEPPSVDEVEGQPNIIVIQLESFQASVIDKEIDGQVLTPYLNEFKNETMYFPNFYHQTHQGRTSDAEFILNTSFYPLKAGSVYTRYPNHSYDSLPEKLEQNGYETAAFHAFRPDFWNRDVVYENFGFDHFYSIDDFNDGEEIGLTLNDRDFFLDGVEKMTSMETPFYGFMVALTSHTPYDFPEERKELQLDEIDEEIIQNYYHTIHFVDQAFGSMVEELKQEDLWD